MITLPRIINIFLDDSLSKFYACITRRVLTYSFFERRRNLRIIARDVIAESTRDFLVYLMNMSFQRVSLASVNVISPCSYLQVTVSSRRHLTRNKLHTEASIGIASARDTRARGAHYSLAINFAICTRNLYARRFIDLALYGHA